MQPVLAIDTCGPSGSIALGQLQDGGFEIFGEAHLTGRRYSAELVASITELLARNGVSLAQLSGIVVVSGPGSFTGVRVGLSTVKGLAESPRIPVVALSRLAVLAHKAGVASAALDAHRHELFVRLGEGQGEGREMLAGAEELAAWKAPTRIALSEDAAADLIRAAWPGTEIARVSDPTAADALALAVPLILAGNSVDIATLDGHYLRRSDAEIFGEPGASQKP